MSLLSFPFLPLCWPASHPCGPSLPPLCRPFPLFPSGPWQILFHFLSLVDNSNSSELMQYRVLVLFSQCSVFKVIVSLSNRNHQLGAYGTIMHRLQSQAVCSRPPSLTRGSAFKTMFLCPNFFTCMASLLDWGSQL